MPSATFFDVNQHYCPLESMGFPTDRLYRKQFMAIVPFLRSRSTPVKLSLDSGCVPVLLHAMETGVRVGSLKIWGPLVYDDDVRRLLSAQNSRYLVELEMNPGRLTPRGYVAVANFLARKGTAIQKLDFGRTLLGVSCAQMLLAAVPPTSTLRKIELGRLYQQGDDHSFATAVQILNDLVCDVSSFDALIGSNHRLASVGHDPGARVMRSRGLAEAFEINERRGYSTNRKIRAKLRAFYFKGEFDLTPFIELDVKFMPNVLELVTMSEERMESKREGRCDRGAYIAARNGHLGCVYRLVRNCHLPELFTFPSQRAEMKRLRTRNAELETTVGSLRRLIDQMNDRLLFVCGPSTTTSLFGGPSNKRLKRKAESHVIPPNDVVDAYLLT
ncbi:hypothetical protein ACHAWF_004998 [Thalassiosira exigua]